MHSTTEIWKMVDNWVGFPVRDAWQRLAVKQGYVQEIISADGDPELTANALLALTTLIRNMHESGIQHGQTRRVASTATRSDGRWELLTDLRAVRLTAEPRDTLTVSLEEQDGFDAVLGHVGVSVTFDSRMPLRALITELSKLWPQLRDEGFVRRTRPFTPRILALIRHVCLDSSRGSTWAERMAAWNKKVESAWQYPNQEAFVSSFHRAEKSLTGSSRGLAYFYDKSVWGDSLTLGEMFALYKAEDPDGLERAREMKIFEDPQLVEILTQSWERRQQTSADNVRVTTPPVPPSPPTPQPPPTHEIATASGPMTVTGRTEDDDHEDEDIPTFKWRPKGEVPMILEGTSRRDAHEDEDIPTFKWTSDGEQQHD